MSTLSKILLKLKLQERAAPKEPTDSYDFSPYRRQFCLRNGISGEIVAAIKLNDESLFSTLKNIPEYWNDKEVLLLLHVISERERWFDFINEFNLTDKLGIVNQFTDYSINQETLAHFAAKWGLDGCLSVLHELKMDLNRTNIYGTPPCI